MANGFSIHPPARHEPCKYCKHPIPGFHAHERCEGLSEGKQHLCMVVTISDSGVKRCGNVRTHSLNYRMGRHGARLYEAQPARRADDTPLYCPEHATQLAITLTIQSRRERRAA